MSLEQISSVQCFGGQQLRFKHLSAVLSCEMHFSVYMPPGANEKTPVVYFLAGLTCTDETFAQKAGAQRVAAQLGLVIVMPDTSPRGEGVPDAADAAYDLGLGAGFYLNAVQEPWRKHYQMYDYVVHELPALLESTLAVDHQRRSICGHSMGGHGALTIALRNPERYRCVSAFAPIVAPSDVPWGQKAFSQYLGEDRALWSQYDATQLLGKSETKIPLMLDQGQADQFFDVQLQTHLFLAESKTLGYPVDYRPREGYDHGYYYIATFIEEHLKFHAEHLYGRA
ncbi:MAG: S-formylglutathione hydrolase [Gammaproteobacteria bacterium]